MKKSFIKNVVAAALSLTLAFSLAGCGETKEASAGSSSKTEEPATEAPAAEEPATETTLKEIGRAHV